MEISIRDMRAEDVRAVYEIEREAFSKPWSQGSLTALIGAPNAVARVAEAEGEIAGYYSFYYCLDEGDVNNIAVLARLRGAGVGKALMRDMLEKAKERGVERLYLEVRSANKAARALYEKFSFKQYSLRKKYYDGEEDAVLYFYCT